MKISIIIPCFNEEKTLSKIVDKVLKFKSCEKEIIIVDDCSTDNTANIINDLVLKFSEIKSIRHEENHGKGAGIKSGIKKCLFCYICLIRHNVSIRVKRA